ncbi:FAD dependent oxidoreductase [Mollisia scopiformis]|uniref:FAD dependent oxidoreductase n=1 Tax=Mollisia scopiformis TaxID=149040 RepID=A0A194WSF7_MOLSC|nr:FAD dependent oxidoreductase [Mollisia scopiformis]KUJ10896.1 FAD dependent oxidoreductase [Mollisia scopiformis]
MTQVNKDSKIIIVGAGVFGLSTALWLAKSGYKSVTVFDQQPYFTNSYRDGADGASADINKIIRFSYGKEIEYQSLALEASHIWDEWNQELANLKQSGEDAGLPPGLSSGDKLWFNSRMLRMSASESYGEFEKETLKTMEKEARLREKQFECRNEADIQRAQESGWGHKVDPFHRKELGRAHSAVLDSTAGFVAAGRSCLWALHLCRKSGVNRTDGSVYGIETEDSRSHSADLIIVACGGWTPTLVPEISRSLETTAGSIVTVQIPQDNQELWDRYAPENMPVFTWGMREGRGMYGFPRMEDGIVKFGYRATKWTNYDDINGKPLSVPKTAHTSKRETNIPLTALHAVKDFISEYLPELTPLGINSTRLCWYTDSIDNSFMIDHVPSRPGLMVCSGGSGHGFKFLPILGREVVKIVEGGKKNVYGEMWRWRDPKEGGKNNGLEEGVSGPRVLAKQKMASEKDWSFGGSSRL